MFRLALFFLIVLTLAAVSSPPLASLPATEPSAADAPIPASLVPAYVAIGKDLCVRLNLVRRTLDDLDLAAQVRHQANDLVDSCKSEIETLLGEIQSGRMPSSARAMAIPSKLRQAHTKLLEIIGPDQSQLLQEKMISLRGQARQQMAEIALALSDVKPSLAEKKNCDIILADVGASVEKLPDADLQGDAYAKARQTMNRLLADAHDRLAAVLTPMEQSELGPHFAELAVNNSSTRPSP